MMTFPPGQLRAWRERPRSRVSYSAALLRIERAANPRLPALHSCSFGCPCQAERERVVSVTVGGPPWR